MYQARLGFTLFELLLVIAIVAIIGATATPFFSRFVLQSNFDSTADSVISAIRKAQAYAMDGKQNLTWGVCVSGSNIRLFGGSCATPTIADAFSIPGSVTISGLSTITFNQRGEPSTPLTIILTSSTESRTVQLTAAGGITIN